MQRGAARSDPPLDWETTHFYCSPSNLGAFRIDILKDICRSLRCNISGTKSALIALIKGAIEQRDGSSPSTSVVSAPVLITNVGILSIIDLADDSCLFPAHYAAILQIICDFYESSDLNLTKWRSIKAPFLSIMFKSTDLQKSVCEFLHSYFISLLDLYNNLVAKHSDSADILRIPLSNIVKKYAWGHLALCESHSHQFVSQHIALSNHFENKVNDGILLFYALEKRLHSYCWTWIATKFSVHHSKLLREPTCTVDEFFCVSARNKLFQITSSCIGGILKRCVDGKEGARQEEAKIFQKYNFQPATFDGMSMAVDASPSTSTLLVERDASYHMAGDMQESSADFADQQAIGYPMPQIADFVNQCALGYYTIMTVQFALTNRMLDPPKLVEDYLRESSAVKASYLLCVSPNLRSDDFWRRCHQSFFIFILGHICSTLTKAFYEDVFNAALGAKKDDTTRRKMLHVVQSAASSKVVKDLRCEVATLQQRLTGAMVSQGGEMDDSDDSFTPDEWYDEYLCAFNHDDIDGDCDVESVEEEC